MRSPTPTGRVGLLAMPPPRACCAGSRCGVVRAPYVRATSLIVRSAGLERQHPTLAALQTDAVAERRDTVPSRFGPLRAKLYTPKTHTEGALLLAPGVNALGIDEPRLVSFARNLASSGFIVLTPELPDLSRYLVTARSTDMLEDAALWFSGRTDLTRGHRIGMAGISFAGGLSVVAAGRPSLAGRLAFVFSFGGHANFQRVVRYLCSGAEPPAPGIDHPPRVPPPHDYGVAIVALDLADQLVPADQVEPLKTGILRFLHASHLALFDQKKAEQEFAEARAMEATIAEPGRTFLHLVNVRDVAHARAEAAPLRRQSGRRRRAVARPVARARRAGVPPARRRGQRGARTRDAAPRPAPRGAHDGARAVDAAHQPRGSRQAGVDGRGREPGQVLGGDVLGTDDVSRADDVSRS